MESTVQDTPYMSRGDSKTAGVLVKCEILPQRITSWSGHFSKSTNKPWNQGYEEFLNKYIYKKSALLKYDNMI